jgi:hypothetical protein
MKTKFTWLLLFIAASLSAQQIPNGGFETWTMPGNPDGWGTWESATGAPLGLATKDTTTYTEGNASIKLKTDSVQAGPQKLLIPAFVSLGTVAYVPPNNLDFMGMPFAARPDTLFFSYKYAPAANDTAWVEIQISGLSGDLLAGGLELTTTSGIWVNAYVPLTANILPGTVDSIRVLFSSSLPTGFGIQGSVLNVDDVHFGYVIPSGVEDVVNNIQISIYPNPVSSVLTISSEEGMDNTRLLVNDLSGKLILVNNLSGKTSNVNVSELPSGVYVYRVVDNAGKLLKKEKFNVVR